LVFFLVVLVVRFCLGIWERQSQARTRWQANGFGLELSVQADA
jgi:hypothetical protein